jgi:hypothetical protein
MTSQKPNYRPGYDIGCTGDKGKSEAAYGIEEIIVGFTVKIIKGAILASWTNQLGDE